MCSSFLPFYNLKCSKTKLNCLGRAFTTSLPPPFWLYLLARISLITLGKVNRREYTYSSLLPLLLGRQVVAYNLTTQCSINQVLNCSTFQIEPSSPHRHRRGLRIRPCRVGQRCLHFVRIRVHQLPRLLRRPGVQNTSEFNVNVSRRRRRFLQTRDQC